MWKSAAWSVYVMKYLTIFKSLIYISFSLSDTMSLMKRWETQPGKPSAWVTWRPSDQLKNLTGMVWTHQFHQNFPGDTIGGHYMNRKRSEENIWEAERYSKIVSGIPSVALPPRRDIPWKLPERGGGCTAPPDTDQKCYFSRQFSDQVLESFTWSTTLFLVLLSLHR